MRTAVISDLHLGTRMRVDLLRLDGVRERLVEALRGFERLVLLGDTLELRDRPVGRAFEVARPFLRDVGGALRGGEVVLVPGNHDHRLALEAFRGRMGRAACGVRTIGASERGLLGAMRSVLGTRLRVAYPGFAIAPGIWATHGHYVDVHSSAPTLECSASALLAALQGPCAPPPSTPDDYEAVLAPTYALFYAIAQRPRLQRLADEGKRLVGTIETRLGTRGPVAGGTAAAAGPGRMPAVVALATRDRLGTAPGELRRPGLRPIGRMLARLGINAEHVLFGHTHRTGPLEGDNPELWRTAGGTCLTNTGSWVYEPDYLSGADTASPYWPGTLVEVEDGRRPRIHGLLSDFQAAA